jgi:hypothetical protein
MATVAPPPVRQLEVVPSSRQLPCREPGCDDPATYRFHFDSGHSAAVCRAHVTNAAA